MLNKIFFLCNIYDLEDHYKKKIIINLTKYKLLTLNYNVGNKNLDLILGLYLSLTLNNPETLVLPHIGAILK